MLHLKSMILQKRKKMSRKLKKVVHSALQFYHHDIDSEINQGGESTSDLCADAQIITNIQFVKLFIFHKRIKFNLTNWRICPDIQNVYRQTHCLFCSIWSFCKNESFEISWFFQWISCWPLFMICFLNFLQITMAKVCSQIMRKCTNQK